MLLHRVDSGNDGFIRGALLVIEICNLDDINMAYGRGGGDEVLRHVARRARAGLRVADILFRTSGNQFVAFLGDADLKTVESVADGIRLSISNHTLTINGSSARLHIAVTPLRPPQDGNSLKELLSAARSQAPGFENLPRPSFTSPVLVGLAQKVRYPLILERSSVGGWIRIPLMLNREPRTDYLEDVVRLKDQGLFADALAAFDKIKPETAGRLQSQSIRAELLERVGRPKEASAIVRRVLAAKNVSDVDHSLCKGFVLARIDIDSGTSSRPSRTSTNPSRWANGRAILSALVPHN